MSDKALIAAYGAKKTGRRFILYRDEDVSGVSGTGIVAEGIVFAKGSAALTWYSASPSVNIYNTVEDVMTVHCHEGKTRFFWIDQDGAPEVFVAGDYLLQLHKNRISPPIATAEPTQKTTQETGA